MKFKKIFILICLIIGLFAIAGVCASDVNETMLSYDGANQELGMDIESASAGDIDVADSIKVSSDDDNTLNLNIDEKLTADKNNTNLDVSDLTASYNEGDYLLVTLKGSKSEVIRNATLTVSLNGTKDYLTDDYGQIKIPIKDLNAKVYDANISFAGNENYLASSKTVKITINKIDSNLTLEKSYSLNYGSSYNITPGIDGVRGIIAKIGEEEMEVIGNKILISGLNAGVYTLTVTTIPDDNHYSVTKNTTIIVKKVDSLVALNDIEAHYGSSLNVNVNVDGATAIIVKIDGNAGNVNGNTVEISKLDAGKHTLTVTTIPDDNHYSVTKTAMITIKKVDSSVALDDVEVSYGNSFNMNVYTDGATGIIAKIDGNDVAVYGNAITIPKLDVGNHILTVTTLCDSNHNPVTRSVNVTVNKVKSKVVGYDLNATVGKATYLAVSIGSFDVVNDGKVTFFDGDTKIGEADVKRGIAALSFTPSKAGNYSILAVYSGTQVYQSSNTTFAFTVFGSADSNTTGLIESNVFVIPIYDNAVTEVYVEILLASDATGIIRFAVNDLNYRLTISNGVAKVKLSNLTEGDWPYVVSYSGDAKYAPFTNTGVFKVNKTKTNSSENIVESRINLNMVLPSLNGFASGDSIEMRLPIDATGTVTLTVNDVDYTYTVSKGIVKVIVPELGDGDCPYTIIYSGDAKYLPFGSAGNFKGNNTNAHHIADDSTNSTGGLVEPGIVIYSLDKPSSDGTVVIKFPSDATGTVTLNVNGTDYKFDVKDGVCKIILPDSIKDDCPFTLTYSGDSKYSSFANTGTFKAVNPQKNVTATYKFAFSNVEVTYATGAYCTITVYANDKTAKDTDVVIYINGKKLKSAKTDSKGMVKFEVTQSPGTYDVKVSAFGKSVTNKLKVKHLLSLKKVTVKRSAKKLILTATLGAVKGKYLKNKMITFKFNGKKYTAKTNSKGISKLTIKSNVLKKLKVGKKVTYQATYLKDTVKYTVQVKK